MKVVVRIAAIAIFFIFFNLSNGAANEITPALPTMKKSTEVRKGWVKRIHLKNGLVALVEEMPKIPLVAIQAQIKTGSATEQGYLGSGISHFVEHMLFKGTRKWPRPGDIEKEVKSLGGYINAFTSHDSTGVNIVVPSGYVNNALEILREVLTGPLFDPNELEKEREVILKEIRLNNDDPSRYLSLLLWSNMFKTHNYRFPVIGYEELFKKLKREDLLNYYKINYIPENIVLGIVGNIDIEEVCKKIEELFGDIERLSPAPFYSQPEPPQIAGLDIEEEKDVTLTYLAMGFHSVSVRDYDMFALDVLSIVLGNGEDSRLFKALYRQRRLVYSIGSFNYTPQSPGIFGINTILKNENLDKTVDEIWEQIKLLKTNLISDKELDKAKNNVLSSYIFSKQTVQDKAHDLVGNEMLVGDYDFSRKYVEGIKAVTKESVREAAKKYLRKENSTIVKLVPKTARKKLQKEKVSSASILTNIEKLELKNNLKVIILQERSLPIITLEVIGLGGLRTEDFKNNGISNLVAETLLCGTRSKTEEEIFSQIEGVGATLDSFAGSNTFGVFIAGLSKDFDMTAQILADVLQNSEFNAEKIEREKGTAIGNLKAINDDIYQTGMRTLKYVLFRNHPYRFQVAGRTATISRLSQEDISDYYKRYYSPSNMILVIAGDIDKKSAKEKITALFEKFEKRPNVKINPPKEKKRPRPRIVTRSTQKEQSVILLGYPGTTIYNHDKYSLAVLSSILSGVNGRLSKTIREEKGFAYTLDAISLPGIERGIFLFYIGTSKENLESAKRELFKEIELLKKDGIKEDELIAVKNELIGLHKMGLQKIQDIARKIGVDELSGLGYDNFLKYENRIRRITKECALRTARKYLNDNSYVLLIIKGQDKDKEG